jgi:hypothetical protein
MTMISASLLLNGPVSGMTPSRPQPGSPGGATRCAIERSVDTNVVLS